MPEILHNYCMKNLHKILLCIALIFCFCITGCTLAPTKLQKDFGGFLAKVDKIECLSYDYNSEGHILRALIYVRSETYNDYQWNSLGGTMEEDFAEYVTNNQEETQVDSLQTENFFVIPATKEKVDLQHLFAVMNILYKSTDDDAKDLSGWAGDLCQLAVDIKADTSGRDYYDLAKEKFNGENSSFNSLDVCADLDAVNIISILQSENKSIAESIEKYYKSISKYRRKTNFMQSVFGEISDDADTLTQKIVERLQANIFINSMLQMNGIKFVDVIDIFNACAKVFAEYLTK